MVEHLHSSMAECLRSSRVECSQGMYGMQEATGLIPNLKKKIETREGGGVCEGIMGAKHSPPRKALDCWGLGEPQVRTMR